MTKKDFVTTVTAEIQSSARTVLAGHGIPGAMIAKIAARPDIVAKLVNFAANTTNFRKGKNALRKTGNFKISAYKNFADFNTKARQDVETFMGRLSDGDIENFTNNTNIVTIIALPDTASGDLENDIVSGKSVMVKFDTSVKKEYRLPGGYYITIMFGDSLIRPQVKAVAKTQARKNEVKVKKQERSAGMIKNRLAAKAKKKLRAVAGAAKGLNAKRQLATIEAQQTANALQALGAKGTAGRNITAAKKRHNEAINKALNKFDDAEMLLFKEAVKQWKAGNIVKAQRFLNQIGEIPEILMGYVRKGGKVYADDNLKRRVSELNALIKDKQTKITELKAKAEAAPTAKLRANINFAIRKIEADITKIKAQISANRGVISGKVADKSGVVASIDAKIAQLQAKGATLQQAIRVATQQAPIAQQAQQVVAQQIQDAVEQGVPVQYAVQQAIQQVPAVQQTIQQVPAAAQNFEMDLVSGSLLDRVKAIITGK